MANPSPPSKTGDPATRPLWIIAISMATIAVCLVLLVVKNHLTKTETKPEALAVSVEPEPLPAISEPVHETPKRTLAAVRPPPKTTNAPPADVPQIIVKGNGAETVPVFVDQPAGGVLAPVVTKSTNLLTGIMGRVVLRGTPPPEAPIPQAAQDATCGKFYSTTPTTHHFVVGDGGGLANTLVYVDQEKMPASRFSSFTGPAVLTLTNCDYVPQISAMHVGQQLLIQNAGSIMHNPHIIPTNKSNIEFNKTLLAGGAQSFRFTRPEFFAKIRCDFHPWEFAWVSVMPHPYFAITDTNGAFFIPNLPDGRYKVRALHRKALATDTSVREVRVGNGESAVVNFTLEAPK